MNLPTLKILSTQLYTNYLRVRENTKTCFPPNTRFTCACGYTESGTLKEIHYGKLGDLKLLFCVWTRGQNMQDIYMLVLQNIRSSVDKACTSADDPRYLGMI